MSGIPILKEVVLHRKMTCSQDNPPWQQSLKMLKKLSRMCVKTGKEGGFYLNEFREFLRQT